MTAHKKNTTEAEAPEKILWYDTLRKLLEPYDPAYTAAEADKFFSTPEIRQALENHYCQEQGTDAPPLINGIELVEQLECLGFRFENTGDLQFHWLMKNKV